MKFDTRASVVVLASIVVVSQPAFSQGAMGPGGAPMAPQPRVAPAPPPPVIAPQLPVVVPQAPMAIPNPANPSAPSPQQNKAEKEGTKEQLPNSGTTSTSKPSGEPARAIIGGTVIAAPKVLSPANGTTVAGADPKAPVAFRWTPVVPKPQEPVTYRLRVWQLMQGDAGTQVMQNDQPVVAVDIVDGADVSIGSPACAQKTCSFVWSVQALNRDGKPIGENNGTSASSGFATAGTTSPTGVPAGIKGSTTLSGVLALQATNTSSAIFDRWGSAFASSTNFTPLPQVRVTAYTQNSAIPATNNNNIFAVGAGQSGQETRGYPITSITISLPPNPDASMKTPPPVLVGLGLSTKPFTIKGNEQQALGRRVEVAHVFPGSVLGKTLNIKVMMPQGSGDATVDWGDGSPATNIREGKPMAGTVAASDAAIVGVVNLLKAP